MSKYIEIVDYTDLCSTAFIKSLDSLPVISYDDPADSIVIDLSNKNIKELFEYYLDGEIKTMTSMFGKKVIIIDTCPLKTNWKRYSIGIGDRLRDGKYYVIDNSLLIDLKSLSKLLEQKWKDLEKKKTVITLSYNEFDIQDIMTTTISLLGENHIKRYETDYKIIGDVNMDYFGIIGQDAPDSLKDLVTSTLITHNLLI